MGRMAGNGGNRQQAETGREHMTRAARRYSYALTAGALVTIFVIAVSFPLRGNSQSGRQKQPSPTPSPNTNTRARQTKTKPQQTSNQNSSRVESTKNGDDIDEVVRVA